MVRMASVYTYIDDIYGCTIWRMIGGRRVGAICIIISIVS